ncbi:hypothetical protein LAZ67_14003112 [Cordylochernes scorpioides]|uniref:Uncharacterized protein n=1 Tax=Cordylochernes scorpioides TaxID=51811 RepID=A0ABY6L7B6_9ARAC|nr:hypothetical protein LAZ67_14003112 [Cordylochernes scorpioides]
MYPASPGFYPREEKAKNLGGSWPYQKISRTAVGGCSDLKGDSIFRNDGSVGKAHRFLQLSLMNTLQI